MLNKICVIKSFIIIIISNSNIIVFLLLIYD